MNFFYIFGILSVIFGVSSATAVCHGCVNIDEYSYEKIFPYFDVVLLKLDDSYPFGDKHNTFTEVAKELVENKKIIIGQVGIKYYGDKDNAEFSKKFGINSKEDLPALRLYIKGEDEPFVYDKNMPWTEVDIKKFIRQHTNIYLGLPGCLETFDKLAEKFVRASDKQAVLKVAEKEAEDLTGDRQKNIAKTYIKFMNKIIETGLSFVPQEEKRLSKLLKGKVNQKKKEELTHRLNILKSFETKSEKTEL